MNESSFFAQNDLSCDQFFRQIGMLRQNLFDDWRFVGRATLFTQIVDHLQDQKLHVDIAKVHVVVVRLKIKNVLGKIELK